jgi:hypothetical protein
MNEHLRIDIYSHNFACKVITPRGRWLLNMFSKNYIQYGWIKQRGKFHKEPLRVFASATNDRNEFRFHINCLDKFKEHLDLHEVYGEQVIWKTHDVPITPDIDFKVKESFTPREHQIEPIEYLINPGKNKQVSVMTGGGKGVISLFAIQALRKKVAIIIRPQFIEKWTIEIIEKCYIKPEEILEIRGSEQLMGLLELGKHNQLEQYKVFIISNKTIQNWYKAYEQNRDYTLEMGYACLPIDLYSTIGVGIRLVDEVHMDLHLQCKIDLYSHVQESISLSATLLSDDPFISRMQDMLYPRKDRYDSGSLDKYIDSICVSYGLSDPDRVRTTEFGNTTYSHMAFEKSIMRNKSYIQNYLDLIDYVIKSSFLSLKRPKKKLAVYASSIDMCTILTQHFKMKYPGMDIRRYCENDPYENLLDPDIRFTTLLSASVGHDISDLTTVILTTNVVSIQSNIQCLGRLRKLSDDHPVEFYYFTCKDVEAHVKYHLQKEKMLEKRAKSIRVLDTGYLI